MTSITKSRQLRSRTGAILETAAVRRRPMHLGIKGILSFLTASLVALLPGASVFADDPPSASFTNVRMFPVSAPPAQYELVHFVLDFAPGAMTPTHSHGGDVFVTVLEGSITHEGNVYGAGDTFTEDRGMAHSMGNEGTNSARVMASILLSPGAAATVNVPGQPAPSVLPVTSVLSRATFGTQPGKFNLMQALVEFPPEAYIPWHVHGGPGLITVIEGNIVFETPTGDLNVGPGEIFVDVVPQDARNVGVGSASTIVTFLIAEGSPVTSFVDHPRQADSPTASGGITPPSTGSGGLIPSGGGEATLALLAATASVFAFLFAVVVVRRIHLNS